VAKKKSESKVASVNGSSTSAVAAVNAVPSSVSAPPAGWVAPEKIGKKGKRPKNGLTLVAPDLASELRKNASAISAELGPKPPAALDVRFGTDVVCAR